MSMQSEPGEFDSTLLRKAFGCFPSGVTAVCAMLDGAPEGIAASSFTSVSIEPPLVSVCVAHTSSTWPRLANVPHLGLSVLAADHGPVARSLASKSGQRFADVAWEASAAGAVFVHGATLWMQCSVFDQLAAGDHDIIVLEIGRLEIYPDVEPMVFHGSQFRALAPAE
jgi:flavin reductase (DIM6/NTAB) family NADH-FMN oxidoreductase RutF